MALMIAAAGCSSKEEQPLDESDSAIDGFEEYVGGILSKSKITARIWTKIPRILSKSDSESKIRTDYQSEELEGGVLDGGAGRERPAGVSTGLTTAGRTLRVASNAGAGASGVHRGAQPQKRSHRELH